MTADQIIEGHRQLIRRAHARGLKIYGGTLTPFEGFTFFGFTFSPTSSPERRQSARRSTSGSARAANMTR